MSPPFAQTENRELIRIQQQLSRLSQNSAHTVQFLPLPSLKPSIFNLHNSNLQLYFLFTPRFSLHFLYSPPPPLSVCPCQNIWSDTLADVLDVNMFPPRNSRLRVAFRVLSLAFHVPCSISGPALAFRYVSTTCSQALRCSLSLQEGCKLLNCQS